MNGLFLLLGYDLDCCCMIFMAYERKFYNSEIGIFATKYLKKLKDVCLRTELLIDMEMKL